MCKGYLLCAEFNPGSTFAQHYSRKASYSFGHLMPFLFLYTHEHVSTQLNKFAFWSGTFELQHLGLSHNLQVRSVGRASQFVFAGVCAESDSAHKGGRQGTGFSCTLLDVFGAAMKWLEFPSSMAWFLRERGFECPDWGGRKLENAPAPQNIKIMKN